MRGDSLSLPSWPFPRAPCTSLSPLELFLQIPDLLRVLIVISHLLKCPALALLDALHSTQLLQEIVVLLSGVFQLGLEVGETLVHLRV